MTTNGVTVIGADNLPAMMPTSASAAYSATSARCWRTCSPTGSSRSTSPTIQLGVVITHDGAVVHEATAKLLTPEASS